jgi:hypothetical protein
MRDRLVLIGRAVYQRERLKAILSACCLAVLWGALFIYLGITLINAFSSLADVFSVL